MKKIFQLAFALGFLFQMTAASAAENPKPRVYPEQVTSLQAFQTMSKAISNHLVQHKVDLQLFHRVYLNMIAAYDPHGVVFLKSDVDFYKNMRAEELKSNFDQVFKKDDDRSLGRVYELYQSRLPDVQKTIERLAPKRADILGKASDISKGAKGNFDPPVDEGERYERLLQMAAVSFLRKKNAGLSEEDAYQMVVIDLYRLTSDVSRTSKVYLYEQVVKAFMASLDPHSWYENSREWRRDRSSSENNLVGVGVMMIEGPRGLIIKETVKDGPADKAGLKAGDIISKVGATSLPTASIEGESGLLPGPAGTSVDMTILRDGKPFQISIVRKPINQAPTMVFSEIRMTPRGKLGILRFDSFFKGVSSEVFDRVEKFKKEGVNGIVLDLRENPGGDIVEAVRVVGLFLKRGTVQETEDARGIRTYPANDHEVPHWNVWNGPLVVLINYGTASASEITSGTLKDYQRAVVVGTEQSFGKGTAQAVMPVDYTIFNDGTTQVKRNYGGIGVTYEQFFTAGGRSPQIEGVKSDIVFPGGDQKPKFMEKELEGAVPFKAIKSFMAPDAVGDEVRVKPEMITALSSQSVKRTANDPKWKKALTSPSEQDSTDLSLDEALNVLSDLRQVAPPPSLQEKRGFTSWLRSHL